MKARLIRIALVAGVLLLVPWVAMQFTAPAAWTPGGFASAGLVLLAAGASVELVAWKMGRPYRAAAAVAVAAALLLFWANGAVGLIGSEDNPANLLYAGVYVVGLGGVFLARLRPRGMALALMATALAQALVPATAFMIWRSQLHWGHAGLGGVFAMNTFFAMLWAASALLFLHAAERPA